ncbi:hypothetical protein AMTR_s00021p00149050 [Amborella trichopoda]|uniref:Pentacotripeptide-repeat region of PRORP domain-containing protein n=1 Tax=Amborella trichopoda TaxID=13333 RepID=W1Q0K7_AMBTC|nr:hypothetical protein AMTR_s00021p00149050 [Amborella trichopoda]
MFVSPSCITFLNPSRPILTRNPSLFLSFQLLSPDAVPQFAETGFTTISATQAHDPQTRLSLLLQACKEAPSLSTTKRLHSLSIVMGSNLSSLFAQNNLLVLYSECGELEYACKVFDMMPQRNAISWNSIIRANAMLGHEEEAWELLYRMMGDGFTPTQFTFGTILSLYPSYDASSQLQALMIKTGLSVNEFAGTTLLRVFARQSDIEYACKLFNEMPHRNVVTWNSMIFGYAENGCYKEALCLFRDLLREHIRPTKPTFLAILFACQEAIESGEQVHGLAIKTGGEIFVEVENALIYMYSKCGSIGNAEKMFKMMCVRDVVSWNSMITAFSKWGKPEKMLELFLFMNLHGLSASYTTFSTILTSCSSLSSLCFGRYIHAKTIKSNLNVNIFVGSALVDMYAKCDDLWDAHLVFEEMPERNVVSWNALISGYSNSNHIVHRQLAQLLFKRMLNSDVIPNEYTYSGALKSSNLEGGLQLHSQAIRTAFDQDAYVGSSIAAMYARNGLMSEASDFATQMSSLTVIPSNIIAANYSKKGQYSEACVLLSTIQEPDMISWNTLIAACTRNHDYQVAFELLHHMQCSNEMPDNYTFVSILSICSETCNLGLGSAIHGLMFKADINCSDGFLLNVLVNMYAKCGSLESSIKVFQRIPEKNVVSWTAMISALGLHGCSKEAIKCFEEMQLEGIKPDRVAFMAVLRACSHGGLVQEGLAMFEAMRKIHGIEPEMDHYACVVDMLCRCGCVDEAERFIKDMPFCPNFLIWRTFLSGCAMHGHRMVGTGQQGF